MWNIYFWVDDVEAIYKKPKKRKSKIYNEIGIKPYGVKENGIQDLGGYDTAFRPDLEDFPEKT